MDNNETEKKPIVASKSFMAVGPTLHYSHKNVQRCWFFAFAVFCVSCIFWSRIVTGSFRSFDIQAVASLEFWRLGQMLVTGVSIFEYPWQIFVLGQLMSILAFVPVLISQLMSFRHSLLFVLVVFFLANLPGFAICLLISCIAAACRPLRFRSRFIAIALCTTPQLLYWGYFGSAEGLEPIPWAFTFAPWICAWLTGLGIAGIVLGIGHFTRYRPGLVWIVTTVVLLVAVVEFETMIGFDELDYQLYVTKNNPEQTVEFHDHSITEALTETIDNPTVRKYLAGFFYPIDDRTALRVELKKEIVICLGQDHWPLWFIVPDELKYQEKRQWLFEQYDTFINRRMTSHRMPIALYYKALLSDYSPDTKVLGQKEILHFYNDYPRRESLVIWYRLYEEFAQSSESLEARWRIAKDWSGQGRFGQADKLLVRAQEMVAERLKKLKEQQQTESGTVFGLFHSPADSVMTMSKLTELQRRVNQLRLLIGPHNRTDEAGSVERLAQFVMLNPRAFEYQQYLDGLLEQMGDKDPLRDNVLLAQAKLEADEQGRAETLRQLHKDFQETDGGMQALYELGLLKISFWRQQDESNMEQKKKLLAEARKTLSDFIAIYPSSFCAEQVRKNLTDLPGVE